jgi:hypothetical protein
MGWTNMVAIVAFCAAVCFLVWVVVRYIQSTEPARDEYVLPKVRVTSWPWPTQRERSDRLNRAAKMAMQQHNDREA